MKSFFYRYKFLIICVCLHIGIFVAAYYGWLNIFFSGLALHMPNYENNVYQGIDFFELPRGAWAAFHGGSLTGLAVQGRVYAPGRSVNANVYHPLFTLTLGSILMQFKPQTAFYIWMWAKLPMSLAGVGYFYWSFRTHKHVQFATCILLVNFNIYLELAAGQYQFLLNLFLLLFLTSVVKRWPAPVSYALYLLTLIVKPVGLLFIPALIIKRQWRVVVPALLVFALTTWIFTNSKDLYYINNVLSNILIPIHAPTTQIITLNALLRSFHWPDIILSILQYASLLLILAFISFRRIHISKAVFLMIVYFLCWYNTAYEYDYSVLAYVIAPCMMYCTSFQTRRSKLCIALICLPSCIVLLTLFHIDISAYNVPGTLAWRLIVISKLVPVFLLCASVIWSDITLIIKQVKTVRSVRALFSMLGDEEKEVVQTS